MSRAFPALLRNGKVLVVGSLTAELFDPASETFVPLGKGRLIYSATLLVDGTVLLLSVTEASIFDPVANQFRNLRSVPNTDLRGIPAVALLEGSVLFAAAGDRTYYLSTYYKESALYDPVTQTFKPAPYLTQPRDGGTATLLKDGRVLVAGGFKGEGPAAYNGILGSAEMYDAATRKFSLLRANMVLHRYIHRATLLRDGRVLITGGYTAPSNLPLVDDTFAELFVPENTQGAVPRLSVDRTQYCVGDSWFLRGDAVNPGAAVQISGTWDEMPWTIPNWTSSDRDGALVGTGTFGAVTIGNHTIWIQAGGKVSNSVFIRVGDCSVHPD